MASVGFPSIPTLPTFHYGAPDFSWIGKLPAMYEAGQEVGRENALRSEIAKLDPKDPNYLKNAAATLMKYDPYRGGQLLQSINNQEALNSYRTQNSLPDDVKLLQWWQQNQPGAGGAEPMRASPPQPSGVPGISLENAPAIIQKKLAPVQVEKSLEAQGTGEGQRASSRAGMAEAAPGVQELINGLVETTNSADKDTFENALGPLQGQPDAETWQGALGQFFPQTAGALSNYFDKGMKEGFVDWKTGNIKAPGDLSGGFTSTLRSQINSTQASLIGILQRVQRVPGIGQQSDKELQQIVSQVGELNKSRTKEDFYDRLKTVVRNLRATGIPVEMPTGAPPPAATGKQFSDRYSNPSQEPPAYDAAQESPPAAVQGSAVDTGNGIQGRGAPPIPATEDKNKLIYLMNNAPPEIVKQKMGEFDKIYNWPGLASIILGQSRAGR